MNKINNNNCSNCGHKNSPERIDKEYIKNELQSLINLEKGFLYSTRELLLKPRISITDFFYDNRNRLVKPITFVIFCTTISVIVSSIFRINTPQVDYEKPQEEFGKSILVLIEKNSEKIEWLFSNDGIMNIVLAVFMTLWLKFFLRKTTYNFFEIMVLVIYTIGIATIFGSIITIIEWSINKELTIISLLIGSIYSASMIGRFLGGKKIKNYLKGALSYILGFISMILTIVFTMIVAVIAIYFYER